VKSLDGGTVIRIPENTRREGDTIYLDEFVIGVIGPLCPDGFMELVASASVVSLETVEEVVAKLEGGEREP